VGSEYQRYRIGIGRPIDAISVSDFVLGRWTESEDVVIRQHLPSWMSVIEAKLMG
jgi:peptidyl-tRNA hydrolase